MSLDPPPAIEPFGYGRNPETCPRSTAHGSTSRTIADPATIAEVPVQRLPPEVMAIHPSRYCQSDRLGRFAAAEFGSLWRGARVPAIQDWVRQQVAFKSNTSDGHTSAVDTLIERGGRVTRLCAPDGALCRALNIPARFVSGTGLRRRPGPGAA